MLESLSAGNRVRAMSRIIVGMSGGVDSSLAACLLEEEGHEVVGVTLKLWPCAEDDGGFTREDACCSPTETIDARAVAQLQGIKHYVFDSEDAFRRGVVDVFSPVMPAAKRLTPAFVAMKPSNLVTSGRRPTA